MGTEWIKKYNDEYTKANQEKISLRRSTPQARYSQQKDAAKRRNIEWQFTFDSWWKIWEESGKYELRGRSGYMMCRNGDIGPYSPDNVRIDTSQSNVQEMNRRISSPT